MRFIAIVLVLVAVLVLAMMNLVSTSHQVSGGASTTPYAHDIQAAQNLVHASQTSATP